MSKKIYVIEGPAGAGKTTLIERFGKEIGANIITVPFDRPRAYATPHGEALSVIKDFAHVTTVLATLGDSVIDRYGISSYVYNLIRRNALPSVTSLEDFLYSALTEGPRLAIRGLRDRAVYTGIQSVSEIKWTWIFLIPRVDIINQRRMSAAPKEYPYSAATEANLYWWVASYMLEHRIESHVLDGSDVQTNNLITRLLVGRVA